MQRFLAVLALVWCIVGVLQAGPAEARRVALAVGIDVYDNLPAHEQLKRAVNDARAMAAALSELGFEATVEENVPRLAFTRAWQRFLNRLEPGDTAALFFAGHGVVVGGVNYLLPRDVPKVELREDRVLAGASIRFNDLMDDLRDKKVGVALFIVDACRDNPFHDGRGRFVGGTRGLFRVEPAKGSFVMYSAGVGERALDRLSEADSEPNSPYTRTLLPILKTPGLSLPEIAVRVRREVVKLARLAQPPHEQTPAYYDELEGDFLLKAGLPADSKPAVAPSAQPPLSEAAKKAKADEEAAEKDEVAANARAKAERALAKLAIAREDEEKARREREEAEAAQEIAERERRNAGDKRAKRKEEDERRKSPGSADARVEMKRYRVVGKLSGGFLAVRVAPNADAREVTRLAAGARGVTKLQCYDKGWCRIAQDGRELGYVNATYLVEDVASWQGPRQPDSICQRIDSVSQGLFQAFGFRWDDPLNIRAQPDTSASIKGTIPLNAIDVEVGVCERGWCPVRHKGVCGWASSQYLRHAETWRAPDR